MKAYVTKDLKNRSYHVEEYQSTAELVRVNKNRPYTEHGHGGNDMNFGKWSGNLGSLEEAYDLLNNGWKKPVEDLKKHVDKISTSLTSKRICFRNNVVGFAPVVPLAIMGVPNSMLDMSMKAIKSKVITIVYDSGATCNITSEQMMTAGTNILKSIVNLEKSGYRINLKLMMSFNDRTDRSDMALINIKEANQPLDVTRIAFPLVHTGMFRIIGFDWEDKAPDTIYMSCRGTTLSHIYSEPREQFHQAFGDSTYYVCYNDAIKGTDNIENILKGGEKK